MSHNFELNMKTLAACDLTRDIVEISGDKITKVTKVTFAGKLWRIMQSVLGIGQGFKDCHLDQVARRLNILITNNLDSFNALSPDIKTSIGQKS